MLLLIGAAPAGRVDVAVEGLRNHVGFVRLCLTRDAEHFPGCKGDPDARVVSVPAGRAGLHSFTALPSGDYAVSVIHDENGNAKLDTFAKVPREGFGFSRNPAIRFGPPSFSSAQFDVQSGTARQTVHIRYFL